MVSYSGKEKWLHEELLLCGAAAWIVLMGWVHFRLGNNSKAIDYLMLALDARQDAEIAAHLGEVLRVTGNREEARKIWEKGIEWDPGNGILKQTIERLSQ